MSRWRAGGTSEQSEVHSEFKKARSFLRACKHVCKFLHFLGRKNNLLQIKIDAKRISKVAVLFFLATRLDMIYYDLTLIYFELA